MGHYKHRTLWFMRQSNAGDVLDFLIAYVCSLSQYVIDFYEEILCCVVNDLRNCTLRNSSFVIFQNKQSKGHGVLSKKKDKVSVKEFIEWKLKKSITNHEPE